MKGSSVILVGFMGAGKSAVGRELSRRTGIARYDTDEMIRHHFGLSIPEIFAQLGEIVFRNAETELLRKLASAAIIVTGGGIVLREENVRLLRAYGRIVWLDADEEILWQRASRRRTRPLLQAANPHEMFSALLRERLPLYKAAADDRIDTSARSVAEIAEEIVSRV